MLSSEQKQSLFCVFFFNDTATTEIYTLSLHDALPIFGIRRQRGHRFAQRAGVSDAHAQPHRERVVAEQLELVRAIERQDAVLTDRKSTRLNSSHSQISYAVFCLKKKKKHTEC